MDKIFPYDSNLVSYIIDASILIPIQPKSSGTKAKTQQKTTNSEKEPENKSQFSKSQQRQQVVLKKRTITYRQFRRKRNQRKQKLDKLYY